MLVGRAAEMDRALRAVAQRVPVVIHGEAGIGKTAFLNAFASQADMPTYLGGGLAGLRWHSYIPLIRALRRPMPRGDALAVASFVTRRAGDGVLLLDDLQWADRETLDLIATLATRLAVVLAYRDRDVTTAPAATACELPECEHIRLTPLGAEPAAACVRRLNPELSAAQVSEVVAASGGNPRFLQVLARDRGGSRSIDETATRWLDECSPSAVESIVSLALAGRPCADAVAGDGVAELVERGLAVVENGLYQLVHGVVGKHAITRLDPPELRRRHARMAERVQDPGEIARHAWAAGAPEVAHRFARAAARSASAPAERGRYLQLAASCLEPGAEAAGLMLDAAQDMLDAGDFVETLRLVSSIQTVDAACTARGLLLAARAHLELGDASSALESTRAGLWLALAADDPTSVLLRIEQARALARLPGNGDEAIRQATISVQDAGNEAIRSAALAALGAAYLACRDERWSDALHQALSAARHSEQDTLAYAIAHTLAGSMLTMGDATRGAALAQQSAGEAAAELRYSWQARFALLGVWAAAFCTDAYADALDRVTALQRMMLPPDVVTSARALHGVVLADLGRFIDAESVLQSAGTEESVQPLLSWARAEAAWLRGDNGTALRLAAPAGSAPWPLDAMFATLSAWARSDTGDGPERHPSVPSPYGGAADEVLGLAELDRDPSVAILRLDAASREWAGRQGRAARRARIGAAEARRRAGRSEEAVAELRSVVHDLTTVGHAALIPRCERALRQCGVRRAAGRSADARGVTHKERAVMELAGQGLTSPDIARRLQISVSTVDSHIRSVLTKLNATNRTEAAALLAAAAPTGLAAVTPIVIVEEQLVRRAAEADLARAGWTILAGLDFEPTTFPDFEVGASKVVCSAVVTTAQERSAALLAGIRGAGLILLLPASSSADDDEFIGDLERLAIAGGTFGLDWRRAEAEGEGLTDEMVVLLRALAGGSTVARAARDLHISLRSAHRRLAMARTALGVHTTQEAVMQVVVRSGRGDGPPESSGGP